MNKVVVVVVVVVTSHFISSTYFVSSHFNSSHLISYPFNISFHLIQFHLNLLHLILFLIELSFNHPDVFWGIRQNVFFIDPDRSCCLSSQKSMNAVKWRLTSLSRLNSDHHFSYNTKVMKQNALSTDLWQVMKIRFAVLQ